MKNKIIITGGAGFIGTELIKNFKNKTDLIIVDKKKNIRLISKFKKLKIRYIQGDLINKNFSKKIYKNAKIIFHLAGQPLILKSYKDPYLTYSNDYLESSWWAFKQIWNRGMVYKGRKPVHW